VRAPRSRWWRARRNDASHPVEGPVEVGLSSLADDLALAHTLADAAVEIALDAFGSGVDTSRKPDGTTVSAADLAVERRLLELLAQHRPGDAILGEELGSSGGSSRRWIIDPIDGTDHFLAGRSDWGPQLALERDGEVVLGVVTRPALDGRWWASRGEGAYRNASGSPARLCVSATQVLSESRISIWSSEPSARWQRLSNHAIRVEPDLNDILRLAAGELECVFDVSGKPWDHAPLVILVEEAGGRFQDRDGGRCIDAGEVRYTNGRIDGQIDAVLG